MRQRERTQQSPSGATTHAIWQPRQGRAPLLPSKARRASGLWLRRAETHSSHWHDLAHFDRSELSVRAPGSDRDCCLEVGSLDDKVPSDNFLRLGKRPVHDLLATLPGPDLPCFGNWT